MVNIHLACFTVCITCQAPVALESVIVAAVLTVSILLFDKNFIYRTTFLLVQIYNEERV